MYPGTRVKSCKFDFKVIISSALKIKWHLFYLHDTFMIYGLKIKNWKIDYKFCDISSWSNSLEINIFPDSPEAVAGPTPFSLHSSLIAASGSFIWPWDLLVISFISFSELLLINSVNLGRNLPLYKKCNENESNFTWNIMLEPLHITSYS